MKYPTADLHFLSNAIVFWFEILEWTELNFMSKYSLIAQPNHFGFQKYIYNTAVLVDFKNGLILIWEGVKIIKESWHRF